MIAACSIIRHSFDTICVEEFIHGSIQDGNCYHPPQILGLPRKTKNEQDNRLTRALKQYRAHKQ